MKIDKKIKDKARLTGTFFSLAAVAVALVLAIGVGFNKSYGWFAANEQVYGSGMGAKVLDNSAFELALSTETSVDNSAETIWETTPYADDAPIVTYLADESNGFFEKIYTTEKSHPALLCNLAVDSQHDDLGENEIAPGSYGHISFDIVVKDGNDYVFDLNLGYLPSAKTASSEPTPVDSAKLSTVNELLSGHILLFTGKDANGYYSGHVNGMTVQYDTTLHSADHYVGTDGYDHYNVLLYWIWPMTYAQIAYQDGDYRLQSIQPIFASTSAGATDRSNIITYIKTNPNLFFYDLDNSVNLNAANFHDDYYVKLSEGYNNGDQFIGDNVHYFVMTVEAGL